MRTKILILLLSVFSTGLYSQTIFVDGAQVAVTKGGILCATGGIENSGDIYNSGTITVAHDWKNNLTYTDKGGVFILNGVEQQEVFQNGELFGILIIDAGGRKVFSSDAGVKDSLILKDGIVEVPSDIKLVLEKNAKTTVGTNYTHIDGVLYNTGTGYKLFPVGTEGEYAPAELHGISDENAVVGLEAVNFNPNPEFTGDLSSVSEIRYWKMTELNGLTFNAKISLNFDTEFQTGDLENLVVAQADEAYGVYTGIGKSNTITPINISGITSEDDITKPYFALAYLISVGNEYYIPNTFSPRATDEDDRHLKIYGKQFSDEGFNFNVYNKWGNLIFTSKSLEFMQKEGWDGTNQHSGKGEEFGMYSYIIKAKTLDGKKIERSNTVLIMK